MLWENLREEEFKPMLERTQGVCAMAIGCVEKHGQHLPLGTDTLHSGKVLELASEREEVCVFPKCYFGDLQPGRPYKAGEGANYGHIILSAELLLALMREICDEIGRNGFKKILLFSGHGGNTAFLGNFIRAVRAEKKDYDVFLGGNRLIMPKDILQAVEERGRSAFPALTDTDISVMEDYVAQGKFDGHGGFAESALIMGLYPELFRMDRCEAESGMSTHIADPLSQVGLSWGGSFRANYPNAYCGHAPIGLTKAIADASVELAVERTTKMLTLLKNDEVLDPILSAAR